MVPTDGTIRPLLEFESHEPGDRLDDGSVVVSEQVAHLLAVGRSELSRRERRAQARRDRKDAIRARKRAVE